MRNSLTVSTESIDAQLSHFVYIFCNITLQRMLRFHDFVNGYKKKKLRALAAHKIENSLNYS